MLQTLLVPGLARMIFKTNVAQKLRDTLRNASRRDNCFDHVLTKYLTKTKIRIFIVLLNIIITVYLATNIIVETL